MAKRNFKIIRTCISFFAAAATILFSNTTLAWDGSVSGKITQIDVTVGNNGAFRVYIGGQAMCVGGPAWAYVNEADSNYRTYVATLLAAKSSGSNVVIYSTKVGSYCQIGYIVVT